MGCAGLDLLLPQRAEPKLGHNASAHRIFCSLPSKRDALVRDGDPDDLLGFARGEGDLSPAKLRAGK